MPQVEMVGQQVRLVLDYLQLLLELVEEVELAIPV
jgi:hypothetical protein